MSSTKSGFAHVRSHLACRRSVLCVTPRKSPRRFAKFRTVLRMLAIGARESATSNGRIIERKLLQLGDPCNLLKPLTQYSALLQQER